MDLLMNSSLSDLLDKALECPVCLEQLDDTARVLPCQHTFCRRCLLEIVHSRRELLCPECRVQCDLNVDDLPPNILLIRLLEGLKGNRKQWTDRSDGQHVNESLEYRSQTSAVVGSQTAGLSINQLFNCKQQIISQSTPNSQPNQSQSPQTPHSALPAQPQKSSIKHSLPTPPLQSNQIQAQPQQTPQLLSPQQQQQSSVKQLVQTPNGLPGAKTLFCLDGKDPEDFVALYNYKPQKADELELKKGEIYSVYKKCHDGWYKGVSVRNGQSGVFPGNYVQLVKSCVPMTSYGCLANTTTSQSRANGQPLHQTASVSSLSKEPPIPKPKPSLPLKPAISVSSGVALESSALTTNPQPNGATDAVVYARPRPTGQPMYEVSRNFSSLVPPPPPPQRPTRPLSSILVPNTKSNEDTAHQLAQALNQSLLISKPQSVSQSSLSDRASPVWHQPKVAATRNTISMVANSSSMRPSGTAITPPPNVSVISSGSGITPTNHRPPLDRKESKSKEKSNFIKRFTSSSKPKRKPNSNNHINSHNISNNSFSCDNPSFVDTSGNSQSLQTIHVRSGSCPNESLAELGSHKKQSSLDDSNTVIKNRMAKTNPKDPPQSDQPIAPPLVRERFRCVVPYPPNSEYELELKVGDVVYVHKKREDGWYKGTLLRTGKTGLFPGPFVEGF